MNLNNVNENTNATGLVKVVQTNSAGETVREFTVPNLVVTSGRNHIAEKIVAGSGVAVSMSHMAIGTGNATPAASDVALGTEVGRITLAGSQVNTNTITYSATFGAGLGIGAITEAGIFNSSTGGTMLCRVQFSQVNKAAGDSIAITWVVTIS
jgi:hypothetical protein